MENNTFQTEYKIIDGKKTLVIKPQIETKINEDGSKDVIIHAPSLSLINTTIRQEKIKEVVELIKLIDMKYKELSKDEQIEVNKLAISNKEGVK